MAYSVNDPAEKCGFHAVMHMQQSCRICMKILELKTNFSNKNPEWSHLRITLTILKS